MNLNIKNLKLGKEISRFAERPVFKGIWITEGVEKEVAVKITFDKITDKISVPLCAIREAELVSKLIHPNIVKVYDWGRFESTGISAKKITGNAQFAIFEFLEGDFQRQKKLYLPQIVDALKFMYSKGFQHNDIRKRNIICIGDRAILFDFNYASFSPKGISTPFEKIHDFQELKGLF